MHLRTSPLHIHLISPISPFLSPLHLPCISPASPLDLPYISRLDEQALLQTPPSEILPQLHARLARLLANTARRRANTARASTARPNVPPFAAEVAEAALTLTLTLTPTPTLTLTLTLTLTQP